MEHGILVSKFKNKYVHGTYIEIIEESELEKIRHKVLQIMPIGNGKYIIERTT